MEPQTFNLTIRLGNVAMQTPSDVGAALRATAERLDTIGGSSAGWIRDDNGNKVGDWKADWS